MKERLVAGLDLGSSAIRLAVGQVSFGQDRRPGITLIGAVEVPSQGIAKGAVKSLEDAVSREEMIDLFDLGAPEHEMVAPRYMSDIAFARVEEIYEKVEAELAKIERSGLLPAGAVLAGGGAKLHGMADVGKATLRLPVSVSGVPNLASPIAETGSDPAFATAVGAMLWGYESERGEHAGGMGGGSPLGKRFLSPLGKIFKSFIP